jgi:hypothetical protein
MQSKKETAKRVLAVLAASCVCVCVCCSHTAVAISNYTFLVYL